LLFSNRSNFSDTGWVVPTQAGTTANRQELWFTYDAENRVQVVNGTLNAGAIVVSGEQSCRNGVREQICLKRY
jgi:hypothetical protein